MASLGLRLAGAALFAAVLLAAVLLATSVSAQPTLRACGALLDAAERAYTEQSYESAESLSLDCVYAGNASPEDLARAHRLLALTYIKADRLGDARLMVVKLVGADPGYAPDPTVELPSYVALVGAVKAQLRVSVSEPPAAQAAPDAPAPVRASEPPAPVRASEPPAPTEASDAPALVRVNVNTVDAETLDTVPGIGPVLAQRIIAYRERHGPFRHVNDLQDVSGIGERSLVQMAAYVTVGSGEIVVPVRGHSLPEPVVDADPGQPAALVNVNTASASELEALPRIGPALAQRIIDFRTEYGPFGSVDELELVRGIGPRTVDAFAHLVTVE